MCKDKNDKKSNPIWLNHKHPTLQKKSAENIRRKYKNKNNSAYWRKIKILNEIEKNKYTKMLLLIIFKVSSANP